MDERFFAHADQLVASTPIQIDRPRGSAHPRWGFIYQLDYGYLADTTAMDGDGIDVWVGTMPGGRTVTGAIVTIDLGQKDAEVKLLVNCTSVEMEYCLSVHNHGGQAGLLVVRRSQA